MVRKECRYGSGSIQYQPLGFGLQLGCPPHDSASVRAKPKRLRDAAHFLSGCALLFCQPVEVAPRHEANNSAGVVKVPPVCSEAQVLTDPATVKRFADLTAEASPSTLQELANMLDKEDRLVVPMFKKLGIKAE